MQFNNKELIYLQIVEYIKRQIVLNNYKAMEKIPSVREMAARLCVNPNTVLKAYDELVKNSIIIPKSTNGYFVTDDKRVVENLRDGFVNEYINEYLNKMQAIGINKAEAINLLNGGD